MLVSLVDPHSLQLVGFGIPWHYGIQCTRLSIEQAFPSVVRPWHREARRDGNSAIDTTLYVSFQIKHSMGAIDLVLIGDFILAVPGLLVSGSIMSITMSNQRKLLNSQDLELSVQAGQTCGS